MELPVQAARHEQVVFYVVRGDPETRASAGFRGKPGSGEEGDQDARDRDLRDPCIGEKESHRATLLRLLLVVLCLSRDRGSRLDGDGSRG